MFNLINTLIYEFKFNSSSSEMFGENENLQKYSISSLHLNPSCINYNYHVTISLLYFPFEVQHQLSFSNDFNRFTR